MPVNLLGPDFEYVVSPAANGDKTVASYGAEVTGSKDRTSGRFKFSAGPPVSAHDCGPGYAYLSYFASVDRVAHKHLETRERKARRGRTQLALFVRKNTQPA